MDGASMDIDPSFSDQSASTVTVCNVKYIFCPVQCQVYCQWAVPKLCAWCIFLQSLEAGGVLWKCSEWQSCGDGSMHLQLPHKLSPGVQWEIKGHSLGEATKATNSSPQWDFSVFRKYLSLSHSQIDSSHSNTIWVTGKATNNLRSRRWIKQ